MFRSLLVLYIIFYSLSFAYFCTVLLRSLIFFLMFIFYCIHSYCISYINHCKSKIFIILIAVLTFSKTKQHTPNKHTRTLIRNPYRLLVKTGNFNIYCNFLKDIMSLVNLYILPRTYEHEFHFSNF